MIKIKVEILPTIYNLKIVNYCITYKHKVLNNLPNHIMLLNDIVGFLILHYNIIIMHNG